MSAAAKRDVAERVAAARGLSLREASEQVDVVCDAVAHVLADKGELLLSGFGTFRVQTWPDRKVRSPLTGQWYPPPQHPRVTFRASDVLKQFVADPSSHDGPVTCRNRRQ